VQEITLALAATIPVGHRVSIRRVERTVWDDDGVVIGHAPAEDALVRDEETGIVYTTARLVPWVDPRGLVLRPPGGGYRSTDEVLRGRVQACVVGTAGSPPTTRLVLSAVVEGGPFR
jgi:hypothetical protein